MYIKAKYPKVGREWYRQGVQGLVAYTEVIK